MISSIVSQLDNSHGNQNQDALTIFLLQQKMKSNYMLKERNEKCSTKSVHSQQIMEIMEGEVVTTAANRQNVTSTEFMQVLSKCLHECDNFSRHKPCADALQGESTNQTQYVAVIEVEASKIVEETQIVHVAVWDIIRPDVLKESILHDGDIWLKQKSFVEVLKGDAMSHNHRLGSVVNRKVTRLDAIGSTFVVQDILVLKEFGNMKAGNIRKNGVLPWMMRSLNQRRRGMTWGEKNQERFFGKAAAAYTVAI